METSDRRVSMLHPQFLSSHPVHVIQARMQTALQALGAEVRGNEKGVGVVG